MKGIPIQYDNQIKIRVIDESTGNFIIDPDLESLKVLENNPLIKEIDGYVVRENQKTTAGISFIAWLFHIETFTGC